MNRSLVRAYGTGTSSLAVMTGYGISAPRSWKSSPRRCAPTASDEQAIAYLGIGSWLGRPRSQNAKGHLLGHVKDLGLDIRDSNVRYYQTNRRLEYHTDSVDIVGLLCLKTAKSGGESYLASSITLFNEMLARRNDLLPALFEPFPTDRRGEVPEGMKPWFDIPIYHR